MSLKEIENITNKVSELFFSLLAKKSRFLARKYSVSYRYRIGICTTQE